MPFYQNIFNSEYVVSMGIVQYRIRGNRNTSNLMVCQNLEPYDLNTYKNLTFNVSLDNGVSYTVLTVDVSTTAVSSGAVKAFEIVSALNADVTFATYFTAAVTNYGNVQITSKSNNYRFKAYLDNSSAETILKFNGFASSSEIPSFFTRDIVSSTSSSSLKTLIQLDGTVTADRDIIRIATGNLTWTNVLIKSDTTLLAGKNPDFLEKDNVVDSHGRLAQVIEYAAGSTTGDAAKKTIYSYTDTNTTPDYITEIPIIL